MGMLPSVLPQDIFTLFLIFARIGSALMILPAFGEPYVPARFRLILAVAVTLLAAPVLGVRFPALPEAPLMLFLLLAGEIVTGLFLGTIGIVLIGILHTAGTIISFQISLSNAFVFDPAVSQQGSLPSMLLTTLGVLLIMVTDLHHMMLRALVDSYVMFTPGDLPAIGDMSESLSQLVTRAFLIGVQLTGPFIAVGLVFYLGVGLLARLMPQVQVFFIAMPLQILFGLAAFAIVLPMTLLWYLNTFRENFASALGAS
jgi:flagellar biosynthetic protein FliR